MDGFIGRHLEVIPYRLGRNDEIPFGPALNIEEEEGTEYHEYENRYECWKNGKRWGVPAVVYKNGETILNYPDGSRCSIVEYDNGNVILVPYRIDYLTHGCVKRMYAGSRGILGLCGRPAVIMEGDDGIKFQYWYTEGVLNNPFGPSINARRGSERLALWHCNSQLHRDDDYAFQYDDSVAKIQIRIWYRSGVICYVNDQMPSVWIKAPTAEYKYWLYGGEMYVPTRENRVCLATLGYRWHNCEVIKNGALTQKSLFPPAPKLPQGKLVTIERPLIRVVFNSIHMEVPAFRGVQHSFIGPYKQGASTAYALLGIKYNERYCVQRGHHGDVMKFAAKEYERDLQKIFGVGLESLRYYQGGGAMPLYLRPNATSGAVINSVSGSCFKSIPMTESMLPNPEVKKVGNCAMIPGSLTNFSGQLEPRFGNVLVISGGQDLPEPPEPTCMIADDREGCACSASTVTMRRGQTNIVYRQYNGEVYPVFKKLEKKITVECGVPIFATDEPIAKGPVAKFILH